MRSWRVGREELLRDLAMLRRSHRARYGTPIFDVRARGRGREIQVEGTVLQHAQRTAIARLARRHRSLHCELDVGVLLDRTRLPQAIADDDVVDVYESARPDAALSTQVTADDAFEVLAEQSARYLVRLDDRTLGWVDDDRVRFIQPRNKRPVIARGDALAAVDEAQSYLGVPYLTGGCSRTEIDCSGLIQRVNRSVFGLVLPRNTRDQMRCGSAVSLDRARPGDTVFLRGPLGIHVGILLSGRRVIHASSSRQRIVIDPLSHLRQSLQLATIRRFVD
jgi:hypothetical protein